MKRKDTNEPHSTEFVKSPEMILERPCEENYFDEAIYKTKPL